MKIARDTLPFSRKIWITKQVSGFCGKGVRMKLWKYRDKNECPLCTEKEDNYQVLHCTSTAMSNKWDKTIQALEATLADNHTPRESIKVIIGYLHLWCDTTTSVP